MLPAPIDDGPHALLDGAILRVDAVDPRKGLRALHLTILQVVVRAVLSRAKRRLVHVERSVAKPALESVFVGQRLGGAVLPVVDHRGDRKSTRLNSSHLGISYAV